MFALIWLWLRPKLLSGAIYAAIGSAVFGSVWFHGFVKGKAHVQAQWDAAIAKGIKDGEATRKKTDARVPLESDRKRLCDDPANRNAC